MNRGSGLRLAGHTFPLRKDVEKIVKIIHESLPEGIRHQGRPRAKYKD